MGKNQAHQARKANFNSGGDGDDAGGRDFGDGMVRHVNECSNRRGAGCMVHDDMGEWEETGMFWGCKGDAAEIYVEIEP